MCFDLSQEITDMMKSQLLLSRRFNFDITNYDFFTADKYLTRATEITDEENKQLEEAYEAKHSSNK